MTVALWNWLFDSGYQEQVEDNEAVAKGDSDQPARAGLRNHFRVAHLVAFAIGDQHVEGLKWLGFPAIVEFPESSWL
ncbi:MAG TPA: hypothetical protein VHY37_01885 [Tepidisphaeraceae bacterium]|nr:hypothetical protein [Tepidisphaeraceae bacterium]